MPVNNQVISLIRMNQVAVGRKFRLKKSPVWLFPENVERDYIMALREIVNREEEIVNSLFIPLLPKFEQDLYSNRPSITVRKDATGEDVSELVDLLRKRVETDIPKGQALTIDIGIGTSSFNDKQWKKIIKATMGIDLFLEEPWLSPMLEVFSAENVGLIKSLKGRPLDEIESLVFRGFQQGMRHETIRKEIEKRFNVARSRAELIARDQVSKLNGQLTEMRQTELGVESYIWQDSDDARVRPTHKKNDGKEFRWKSPPSDTGHPGQDYQCRCWADPNLKDIIGEEFD